MFEKYLSMLGRVWLTILITPLLTLAQTRSQFIPDDFVLFWPAPVRAYPGIPVDFRFSAYEVNNERLSWTLLNAPFGMTISEEGRLNWTPAAGDDNRSYSVTVRVSTPTGKVREKTFSLKVNQADFIFVSPSGNNANSGTIDSPLFSIEHALRNIRNGDGKTVYLRGGVYQEAYHWETAEVSSPLRGKTFSESDPVEVRSYPGESAILDCQFQGHGLWAYSTSYVIFGNLEVRNANAGERGGIIVTSSDNIVVRDTVVQNSRWSKSENVTGYLVQGGNVILDRAVGYENKDPSSDHWNSSNFLIYSDGLPADGVTYVLNSRSWGSIVGFKIKHAGAKKVLFHNCQSTKDNIGFGLAGSGVSVRYSVTYHTNQGISWGITDPNTFTESACLAEHNTIVNSSATALQIQTGYLTGAASIFRHNIFYNDLRAAGAGEDDGRLYQLWIYDPSARTRNLDSDYNLFFSQSRDNIVRLGNDSNRNYSFSDWQAAGHDLNSRFENPGFSNVSQGLLNLSADSPVVFPDGSFAGAYSPGRAYPPVGTKNLDLPPSAPTGLRATVVDN